MNRNRIPLVLLAAVLGSAALAGCKKKEETAPAATVPPPATLPDAATAPAARAQVTSVDLGNAVDADMKIGMPKTTFARNDTLYVSIGTSTGDPAATVPATLGVKWTHLDSNQTVSQDTRQVELSGQGNTEFHITKPDGWPTGKYRVEVSLDGNVVQSREFEVR